MGTRKSGFDPLSSLFDNTSSSFMDDTTSGSFSLQLVSDSLPAEETLSERSEDTGEVLDKAALARELAKAAMARAESKEEPPDEKAVRSKLGRTQCVGKGKGNRCSASVKF